MGGRRREIENKEISGSLSLAIIKYFVIKNQIQMLPIFFTTFRAQGEKNQKKTNHCTLFLKESCYM